MDIQVYCAHSRMVDIEAMVENPRNPNKHSDKQISLLAKIIKSQGWRNPIVVSNRSGFIVKGHCRLATAPPGSKRPPKGQKAYPQGPRRSR